MGTLTECPDCERHFVGDTCVCGYVLVKAPPETVWRSPAWMEQPAPCTAEENYRAAQNVQAVLKREITVHQAHLVLHAIFQGRELDEGGTTCACGIDMTPRPARRGEGRGR
jgi:hypothetical protein